MTMDYLVLALYLLPLLLVLALYARRRRRVEAGHAAAWREARETGLTEPPSLHPVIDPGRCIGSGACAKACPEKALGVIDGKGFLTNPSLCIGHGACAAACPVEAIRLVFGTERRGMDIPQVNPRFETNVPGIFIAGELGGMGLIRKAAEQGRQAMEAIAERGRGRFEFDVVIVGAGPGGISATLAAKKLGLSHVTLEQEASFGGTALHYPRNKIVMTAPMDLPLVGKVKVREISKESLLELWQDVVARTAMEIRFGERMEGIAAADGGFVVTTSRGRYRCGSVLLAIGRRGTPRKLDVPGEDLPKVVYRLIEPEQYRGQRVLVVGGGDSALEAALALAEAAAARVTLSYRGAAFSRVKAGNRERLDAARRGGRIEVLLESTVRLIEPGRVTLEQSGVPRSFDNDAVIVCAGGVLPTPFLREIGVMVETRYGH